MLGAVVSSIITMIHCIYNSINPGSVSQTAPDKRGCETSQRVFRCWCDTSVSLYRWRTMRRTQTCPRSPRWPTAREVHQCYSGVFRNIQCIRCRCWHSHRWATAPRATPYCSKLKKMVGSLTLTLIPDPAFQRFAQHSLLSYLSCFFSLWILLPTRALSTAQTFIYNISVLVCSTRAHLSNAPTIKLSAAGLICVINKSHVHRRQNIKYQLSKISLIFQWDRNLSVSAKVK